MSNDSEVKVVSDTGHRFQWATGLFYRNDGFKKTLNDKNLKRMSIALFVVISTFMLFRSGDEPPLKSMFSDTPRQEMNEHKKMEFSSYEEEARKELENERKKSKTKSSKRKIIVSKLSIISRDSKATIAPGAEVKAKLVTAATDGRVKAILLEDLESFDEVLAKEGTVLLGKGQSGEERLFINFQKMIHPNGKVLNIKADTYDLRDQTLGIKGSKIGKRALKYLATTGLHFAAGVSQGLQDTKVKDGVSFTDSSLKNALLNGAGTAALSQSKEMMESLKEKQNLIHVKAGTDILIVFEGSDL